MTNIIPIRRAPTDKRSRSDTLVITEAVLRSWQLPPFQRPLKENEKVKALVEELKTNGGVIPGVITLGQLGKDKTIYVIDGQHRLHAFELAQIREAYADVRIVDFDSINEMGEEFVKLNSALVRMRPDDVLRGLESSHKPLQLIRHLCPFVGYDQIRRSGNSPVVGMSLTLRAWTSSSREAPGSTGRSAFQMASEISLEDARQLSDFLNIALKAWGREYENSRLWGGLNLTLCMWLYRQLVLSPLGKGQGQKRFTHMSPTQFEKCLLGLASASQYVDWLWGRQMGERDRAPAYRRIRDAFASRMASDGVSKTKLPAPPWSMGRN